MTVLVVLGAVVAGLAVAWELRFVALWLLVRVLDASEAVASPGRRSYADFRRVVAEQGVAGLDLAWRSEPDGPDVSDRADWQLGSAC
ncbi:hypothetical protein ACFPK1_03395 [Actinomycetospora rhizophila]|uniref:Uncharacterized protein n=1 Tax=Actinomycetospora rhizophila TaxID=1416876 RepID=A0ABV9ZA87_9PSEU